MKHLRAVLPLGLILLVAACGGGGSTTPPSETPETPAVHQLDLSGKILDWPTGETTKLEARPINLETVEAWLHNWSNAEKELLELRAALSRAHNEDTRDKGAEKAYLSFVREVQPQAHKASHRLTTKLLELDGFVPAADQEGFVKRFRNAADLFREANLPLLAEEAALSSEYNKLVGGLTVNLDGETLTVPEAEKRLLDPDRALRERAFRAVSGAKLSISGNLDALFLKLLELRRDIARNAELEDYRSFRWRALNRFDYTPQDNLALHDAIAREAVPLIVELRDERRSELGVSELRPWDLLVDSQSMPPLKPFETVGELEDGMVRIFSRLDPELAEQFGSLRDGWLDLEARAGKVPGLGYQSFFPKSQKPYIYWSASGIHADVTVLVYEAGHAFHSLAASARHSLLWNRYAGEEFAEVASQSMELLTLPYLTEAEGGFYTEKDAARARREGLERVLHQLPSLALSDAFQHWLYAEAPEDVGIKDMDAKWLELSRTFSPSADWSDLEHIRAKNWQYFHIFAVPFYMLEYAYAWLGAVQIWRNALEDPRAALSKYRGALALGGTRSIPELYEAAGARFGFDRQTVGELMRFVYNQR